MKIIPQLKFTVLFEMGFIIIIFIHCIEKTKNKKTKESIIMIMFQIMSVKILKRFCYSDLKGEKDRIDRKKGVY